MRRQGPGFPDVGLIPSRRGGLGLRYATMPENHTFLGGSGLIIPKKARVSATCGCCKWGRLTS